MENEKTRTTIYLDEERKKKLQSIIEIENLNPKLGRTEAIDKAIDFYYGYLSGQLSMDFLCGVFGQQVDSSVKLSADRISALIFKQAVEINMIARMLAEDFELTKDEYDKMRSKAVAEVKRSNGRVSMFETMQDIDA